MGKSYFVVFFSWASRRRYLSLFCKFTFCNQLYLLILVARIHKRAWTNQCTSFFLSSWLIVRLIDWWFTVFRPAQEFFTYMEMSPLPVKGCKIGLCSALRAFEQGVVFIVPHLLWHGTSVFPVSSEKPTHLVASYDTQSDVEDLI
jgi:hypothetical protein